MCWCFTLNLVSAFPGRGVTHQDWGREGVGQRLWAEIGQKSLWEAEDVCLP